jgi:hypothetical protein
MFLRRLFGHCLIFGKFGEEGAANKYPNQLLTGKGNIRENRFIKI